eukprot:Lankesteria_metandrocarpae@DN4680_c0_g1_i1.p1
MHCVSPAAAELPLHCVSAAAELPVVVPAVHATNTTRVVTGGRGMLRGDGERRVLEAAARERVRRADHNVPVNNFNVPMLQYNAPASKLEKDLGFSSLQLDTQMVPNDRYSNLLWNLDYIKVHTAWALAAEYTGTGTGNNKTGTGSKRDATHAQEEEAVEGRIRGLVVVVDSGIDIDHEDLQENIHVNTVEFSGLGEIDDDGNGYVDDIIGYNSLSPRDTTDDQYGHGTHVAGIVGAVVNNTSGVYGVNPNAQLVPCRFMDAQGIGFVSGAVACIDYALAIGASVSNHSWSTDDSSHSLKRAIRRAGDAGHVLVVSAGNTGEDLDTVDRYPATYQAANLVVVGSSGRDGTLSTYSCRSTSKVHLAAPGDRIASTINGNRYAYKSGTSMAAPHVAGALSFMWQLRPYVDYKTLVGILLGAATPTDALTKYVNAGALNFGRAVGDLLEFEP